MGSTELVASHQRHRRLRLKGALVRRGFTMVLDCQDDIEVVAEAGDGREAIEAARTYRPDVILMDIRMPGIDGLTAASTIIAEADGAPSADPDHLRRR